MTMAVGKRRSGGQHR